SGQTTPTHADFVISPPSQNFGDDVVTGAAAWGGPNAHAFLVAWSMGTGTFPPILAATVGEDGTVAAPFQVNTMTMALCTAIGLPPPCYGAVDPFIVSDGTQYLVTWGDQ